MTTLPTYLPGLMRDSVAAGLDTEVRFSRFRGPIGVELIIAWGAAEYTTLGWTLLDDRWVPDRSNLPLRDVRARIKREAQR